MKHCGVVTTDASGRVMFEHAPEQLFKSIEMDGCSIYLDSEEEPPLRSPYEEDSIPLLAGYAIKALSDPQACLHRYLLHPCSIRCSVAIFRPVSAESIFGEEDGELPVLRHRVVLQLAESSPRLQLQVTLAQYRALNAACELQNKMATWDQYRGLHRCVVEAYQCPQGREEQRYRIVARHETAWPAASIADFDTAAPPQSLGGRPSGTGEGKRHMCRLWWQYCFTCVVRDVRGRHGP